MLIKAMHSWGQFALLSSHWRIGRRIIEDMLPMKNMKGPGATCFSKLLCPHDNINEVLEAKG